MARKSTKKAPEPEPMKLFYIFYNKERWDNWIATLKDSDFGIDPKSDVLPAGFQTLNNFSEDITLSVLKIERLCQNTRFTKEEALGKLAQVEEIVMSGVPEGDLGELIEWVQLSKLVLFASCRKYLEGGFEKDIRSLVKKGRELMAKDDNEKALEAAAQIGASVIDGASCCGKYMKDDIEQPTLFDEWLIECERMNEAMNSLRNFDEVAGEED
jgi:hypothetical protein